MTDILKVLNDENLQWRHQVYEVVNTAPESEKEATLLALTGVSLSDSIHQEIANLNKALDSMNELIPQLKESKATKSVNVSSLKAMIRQVNSLYDEPYLLESVVDSHMYHVRGTDIKISLLRKELFLEEARDRFIRKIRERALTIQLDNAIAKELNDIAKHEVLFNCSEMHEFMWDRNIDFDNHIFNRQVVSREGYEKALSKYNRLKELDRQMQAIINE